MGICEIKGMMIGLSEVAQLEGIQKSDPYVLEMAGKVKSGEDVSFLKCPYGHICGMRVKFQYYLSKQSPVLFKFPMGVMEDWDADMRRNNFAKAYAREEEAKDKIDWSGVPYEDLVCTICMPPEGQSLPEGRKVGRQFETMEEFCDHIERDREHLENYDKFLFKEIDESSRSGAY